MSGPIILDIMGRTEDGDETTWIKWGRYKSEARVFQAINDIEHNTLMRNRKWRMRDTLSGTTSIIARLER